MESSSQGDEAHIWSRRMLAGARFMHARYRRHAFRAHSHDTFTFGIILEGAFGLTIDGLDHQVEAGRFSFIEPHAVHTGRCLSAELEYRNAYVGREALEGLLGIEPDSPWTIACHRPFPADAGLARDFRQAHAALQGHADPSDDFAGVLGEIVRRFFRRERRASREPAHRRAVRRVLDVLRSSYERNVSLEELSSAAGLSRFHLLRVFRAEMGMPPHAYLLQVRIEHAIPRLLAGESLADVALRVGFYDQSHFGRYFKSIVGTPPGDFIATHRRYAAAAGPG